MSKVNIYASYKNPTNDYWVIDGEKGKETYPLRFSKEICKAAYKGETRCYECGKYIITIYEHDIKYSKGNAALVTIDRFDLEGNPLDSKSFYLPEGKDLDLRLTETDIDYIYTKRKGSWL